MEILCTIEAGSYYDYYSFLEQLFLFFQELIITLLFLVAQFPMNLFKYLIKLSNTYYYYFINAKIYQLIFLLHVFLAICL